MFQGRQSGVGGVGHRRGHRRLTFPDLPAPRRGHPRGTFVRGGAHQRVRTPGQRPRPLLAGAYRESGFHLLGAHGRRCRDQPVTFGRRAFPGLGFGRGRGQRRLQLRQRAVCLVAGCFSLDPGPFETFDLGRAGPVRPLQLGQLLGQRTVTGVGAVQRRKRLIDPGPSSVDLLMGGGNRVPGVFTATGRGDHLSFRLLGGGLQFQQGRRPGAATGGQSRSDHVTGPGDRPDVGMLTNQLDRGSKILNYQGGGEHPRDGRGVARVADPHEVTGGYTTTASVRR